MYIRSSLISNELSALSCYFQRTGFLYVNIGRSFKSEN